MTNSKNPPRKPVSLPMIIKAADERRNMKYDRFVRGALAAGFTDDQVDFLWDQLAKGIID